MIYEGWLKDHDQSIFVKELTCEIYFHLARLNVLDVATH